MDTTKRLSIFTIVSSKLSSIYKYFYMINFSISLSALISSPGKITIFGGDDIGYKKSVVEFTEGEWNKIGDLIWPRSAHNVINIGQETLIIGGGESS